MRKVKVALQYLALFAGSFAAFYAGIYWGLRLDV